MPSASRHWPCGGGGYLDTITEPLTGLFFKSPEAPAIAAAVRRGRETHWDELAIVDHARRFNEAGFRSAVVAATEEVLSARGIALS